MEWTPFKSLLSNTNEFIGKLNIAIASGVPNYVTLSVKKNPGEQWPVF